MQTSARTPIHYRCQHFTDGPLGPRTMLFFYPGGEWDGWRRRPETCEKVYPQSEYQWLEMHDSMDVPQNILKEDCPEDNEGNLEEVRNDLYQEEDLLEYC